MPAFILLIVVLLLSTSIFPNGNNKMIVQERCVILQSNVLCEEDRASMKNVKEPSNNRTFEILCEPTETI